MMWENSWNFTKGNKQNIMMFYESGISGNYPFHFAIWGTPANS
jgi:hypothetical protein